MLSGFEGEEARLQKVSPHIQQCREPKFCMVARDSNQKKSAPQAACSRDATKQMSLTHFHEVLG
jgi:hypothetical protein